jgi:hypothetical protein
MSPVRGNCVSDNLVENEHLIRIKSVTVGPVQRTGSISGVPARYDLEVTLVNPFSVFMFVSPAVGCCYGVMLIWSGGVRVTFGGNGPSR